MMCDPDRQSVDEEEPSGSIAVAVGSASHRLLAAGFCKPLLGTDPWNASRGRYELVGCSAQTMMILCASFLNGVYTN